MTGRLRWLSGESHIQSRVDQWLNDQDGQSGDTREIAGSERRSVIALREPGQASLLIKCFRPNRGRHSIPELVRAAFGHSDWQREWWGLTTLWNAGVAVPKPLGLARFAQGDALIVCEFIEGPSLWTTLHQSPMLTGPAWTACAQHIAAMHGAGVAHGDLHPGNLMLPPAGPVLIDFQRSTRIRPRSRITDLARLDFSLALLGVSEQDRDTLLRETLGSESHKRALRNRIERRALKLSSRHRRRRMRESLHEGADRVALRWDGHSGLRRPEFEEETIRGVLSNLLVATGDAELADEPQQRSLQAPGGRQLLVHQDRPRTLLSRARQSLFGSRARRIWRYAHDPANSSSGIRVLAFGERRTRGILMSCFWIEEKTSGLDPDRLESPMRSGKQASSLA